MNIQDTDIKCIFKPVEFLSSVRNLQEFLPKLRYMKLGATAIGVLLMLLIVLSSGVPNGIGISAVLATTMAFLFAFLMRILLILYVRKRLRTTFYNAENLLHIAGVFSSEFTTKCIIEPLYDAADQLAADCNIVMRGRFYHFFPKDNPSEAILSISILSNDIVVGLHRNRPFKNHLLFAADSSFPNVHAIIILRELAQHHIAADIQ